MAARTKAAPKAQVPGITFVRELGGIQEYRLEKNGLRILLVPDDAVPVAGCMVTYHVGSRDEATGYTGATHLLEHLMFKGSERFDPRKGNALDQLIERQGGLVNATTWWDRTNYYEVVPETLLFTAIEAEADRMRTARIVEEDRMSEMPVVRNEFERIQNRPSEALDTEIWAAAFQAHPYHHNTIGWRSDIEKVPIERLQRFYDDFYWPDNATVTIAGSFDAQKTLEKVKKEFGRHPKKPAPYPQMYTEEPLQQGERRVTVKRAGQDLVAIAHKIPNAHHADIPALLMLSSVLTGDKTSRLYRAFVDTAKALDVSTYCFELKDPALFETFVTLAPKVTHADAEKLLRAEFKKLQERGVTVAELSRAKRSARTYLASRRDGTYAFLATLNEDLATGDWTRFVTLPEAIQKVTPTDVKRVAKEYLADDRSVVGYFINTAK